MTEFKPSERQSICDLLVPPDGYRFESAIGTSYSLDFVALTACCAALLDQEVDRDKEMKIRPQRSKPFSRFVEPSGLFVNQAGLKPDSRRNPLLLSTISCTQSSSWARVSPEDLGRQVRAVAIRLAEFGQPIYRLVCGSRHVTTAQTWEACVAADGAHNRRPSPGEAGPALAGSLTAVLSQAKRSAFARPPVTHGGIGVSEIHGPW